MYMVIEAMADGGVKQGLPRDLAYRLAAQTMVGAGKMVLDTGRHPAELKDEVWQSLALMSNVICIDV